MKLILEDGEMKPFGKVVDDQITIIKVPLKNNCIEMRDALLIEHYIKSEINNTKLKTTIDYIDIAKRYKGMNSLEIMDLSKKSNYTNFS